MAPKKKEKLQSGVLDEIQMRGQSPKKRKERDDVDELISHDQAPSPPPQASKRVKSAAATSSPAPDLHPTHTTTSPLPESSSTPAPASPLSSFLINLFPPLERSQYLRLHCRRKGINQLSMIRALTQQSKTPEELQVRLNSATAGIEYDYETHQGGQVLLGEASLILAVLLEQMQTVMVKVEAQEPVSVSKGGGKVQKEW